MTSDSTDNARPGSTPNRGPADSRQALADLYETLRAIAQDQMGRERMGHTLQATAVVHEAYLRVADINENIWRDRNHFLSVAASTIRRVLVDHARGRDRLKRGGGAAGPVTLNTGIAETPSRDGMAAIDVLALDDALTRLAQRDEQAARLVELRFFGGLTIEDAADLLGIGRNTASRRWRVARAWLRRELGPHTGEDTSEETDG
jgi:RNA polymerase sigma-70 factor (ECF subfamily)